MNGQTYGVQNLTRPPS